jgi:hypothetical protein
LREVKIKGRKEEELLLELTPVLFKIFQGKEEKEKEHSLILPLPTSPQQRTPQEPYRHS